MAKKNTAPRKSAPGWLPYLIAGLFVLGLVLIVIFGSMAGPVTSVKNAAKKTLQADNFTTTFSITLNGQSYEGTINAALDMTKQDVLLYMQVQTAVSDYICGIYNKTFAICDVSENELQTVDVSKRVTEFFRLLEDAEEPDWSVLLDFEETDLYEVIGEDFEFTTLLECMKALLKRLDSTDWAKTNAGYSKTSEGGVTYHSFRPKLHTLATQVQPDFRAAFKDPARYTQLEQYVDEAQHILNAGKADLIFGVKGGRLISASLDVQYHNTALLCRLEFIGINSTQVDFDTIAYFIDQSKKTPEEQFEDFYVPGIPLG